MKKIITVIAALVIAATTLAVSVGAEEFFIPAYTDIPLFHNHEYVEEITAPDCINDGIAVYTCECGDTYSVKASDATGHCHVAEVVEPTCVERGYINNVCDCGDSYKDNFTDALGHNFGEWFVIKMPSVDANGIESHICSVCEYEESREFVCEHAETSDVVVVNATCQTGGSVEVVCNACESVVASYSTPASAHEFGSWKTVKAAAPGVVGEKTRSCSCGLTETQVVEFKMAGDNSIYIASAGINVKYVVAPFTQAAVDTYDVVCNYTRLNQNNPIVLGHNTGSLKKLYNTQIGSYIYFNVDGVTHTYKVKVSERAVETDDCTELKGLSTGYELLDSYEGNTIRLYTCYQDKEYGKIRWIVMAEKVS